MRAKSGLHPYDAGLFFILRGCGKRWPLRDVAQVSGWTVTRMLAHQFDKPVHEVAKEIIDLQAKLEDGSMSTNGNGTTQQLEKIAQAATATTPGGAVVEDFLTRVESAATLLTEVAKELGNIGEEDESAILADADALRGQMRQIVGRLLARKRRELGDLERILGKIEG